MIWADRIAKELKGKPQHVDDMKTPSGYIHTGSLRGPILHDVMYKALKREGNDAKFTYVFNDFDPIDGLSDDLRKDFTKYLGFPLRTAPSPDRKARSFADFFALDFKKVLKELGCEAIYLSSWDMYKEGKFNKVIEEALNNAEKIQDIYQRVSGSQKRQQGWYPLQVICPNCNKIGTTKVTGWDRKVVTFSCEKNLVKWAVGCGHSGTISPYDGNGKLPWKVDWAAHWKVLGVTFEGAGKDHASKGGSYDIAFNLCDEVFHYPRPYYFPYEHFLLGGRKMSSSKGVGLRASNLTSIIPAELGRFLMVRTLPNRAIEFNPEGGTIPDLFDEFDRCAQAYWDRSDPDMARIFELSQVNDWYKQKVYLPRFNSMSQYTHLDLESAYKKAGILFEVEKKIFSQRLSYYKTWAKTETKQEVTLTEAQKKYLIKLAKASELENDPVKLQQTVFDLAKQENLPVKQAFTAIYISLTGKTHGPKAGELLASFNRDELIKKLTTNK